MQIVGREVDNLRENIPKLERVGPIPEAGKAAPRTPEARALVRMKPGQSFTVPRERRAAMGVMATWYGRKLGRVYTVRRDGPDKVRIWRVS